MSTAYVGNVPFTMLATEGAVSAFFSSAGGCGASEERVPKGPGGRAKGFAFLSFADPQDLKKAIELNGVDCEGRQLKVSAATGEPYKEKDAEA